MHVTKLPPSPVRPAPRSPVLGWSNLRSTATQPLPDLERLPHKLFLTSGRAAIHHALQQLGAAAGRTVLVPSYHCPTMVAPALMLGAQPQFYGVGSDGLPLLDTIDAEAARHAVAILVPHYFGLPRPLHAVRDWCDAHDVSLIEDCAHCYFGAGVGSWGDFATGSISKFFPVPEAGLLASARRAIEQPPLLRGGWKAEVKGAVDVLEHASRHRHLAGLDGALRLLFGLKNLARRTPATAAAQNSVAPDEVQRLMLACDMGRISRAPLRIAMLLNAWLPRSRIVERRRSNYERYGRRFAAPACPRGVRPLFDMPVDTTAPYVFPLWVDDAERVYRVAREQGLPVFRWDRVWPGVPAMAGDMGPAWSRHVLQLLCHQDLSPHDIDRTADALLQTISASAYAHA